MNFLKWSLFFLVSFAISFILISTFSQDVFKEIVPARILWYATPSIPIYYYITGSFFAGLFIGLFVAVYNYFTSTANSLKKSRRIKDLEKEVDLLSEQQAQAAPGIEAPSQEIEDREEDELHKKPGESEFLEESEDDESLDS